LSAAPSPYIPISIVDSKKKILSGTLGLSFDRLANAGGDVDPKFVNKAGFFIIGIEVRTSNRDEMTDKGKIGGQWSKFHSENVLARIPGKCGDAVLGMYIDYESDVNGEYSHLIGCEVDSLAAIPDGMVGREIPAMKYAVFASARGAIPGIIIDVWKQIWNYTGATRAYLTDFEVYGKESSDPANAQIEVYLSIR
jgi:predicted transcriptional regulator YdeE